MEPYRWYKNDELPDKECDCVIIYKEWHRQEGKARLYKNIGKYKKSSFGYVFADQRRYDIEPLNIISYMPIEYPKEVE